MLTRHLDQHSEVRLGLTLDLADDSPAQPGELGVPMGARLAGLRPGMGRSGSATAAAVSAMAGHASSPAADPPDEVRLYQHDHEPGLDLP